MLDLLSEERFNEYFTKGYVDTGIVLDGDLVERMRAHYRALPENRNDYPQYFRKNEHQASLESRLTGLLFRLRPKYSQRMVERLYTTAYNKAVHAEQAFIASVCDQLLAGGFHRIFRTRYLVASYDIYLGNDHRHRSFTDIHSDIPNFHHFYETESDLTVYIPLVDVNARNGGRLSILPESRAKLKVPGNVLLKIMEDHFGANAACLDEHGYIDPERIGDKEMAGFIASDAYRDLMQNYRTSTQLARDYYAGEFVTDDWPRGKAVLFTNKNFHAAESWRDETQEREVYMLRLLPVYDCRIRLKGTLHGRPFNNFLIDTEEGKCHRYDHAVDLGRIPASQKLRLRPAAKQGVCVQA